ncbi:MAG: hypothetical protein HQL46_05465 [Gammaproteobacteria bacterium]|nr:hypothetical protein [Gammaproteobacteria bacterium]
MALSDFTTPEQEAALNHSIKDGSAYSIMTGAGESYLSAYAIHLRFSEPQLAILASLPPLLGALSQIFSVWLYQRWSIARRKIILFGAIGQALIWLPIMLIPLLLEGDLSTALIICVVAYYLFGHIISPHWPAMMKPLVPEKIRGQFFSRRTRLTTLASFSALVIAGAVLEWAELSDAALTGFLLLFTLAGVARLISSYYLSRLPDKCAQHQQSGNTINFIVPLWKIETWKSPFGSFIACYGGISFATAIAAPFFAIYLLRDLQFGYIEFMAITASSVFMQFLTLNGWGRVSDAFGNRLILMITGWMIPLTPLLWIFSENFFYLLMVQAFAGLAWGGFSLSATSFIYDLTSDKDLSASVASMNLFNAFTTFFGAQLGALIILFVPGWETSDFFISLEYPLWTLFILSFLLRLLAAIWLLPILREVRKVRSASPQRVLLRFSRFSAFTGIVFDIAGFIKRSKAD